MNEGTTLMTNSAKYKLATQAILMAYELLAPDSRSADDLKQHILHITDENTLFPERIFFEAMDALNEGLMRGKWFYRD